MNDIDQGMEVQIDNLIEDLIADGTFDSAAVASILLATRAAIRDGHLADLERVVWWFHDSVDNADPIMSKAPIN